MHRVGGAKVLLDAVGGAGMHRVGGAEVLQDAAGGAGINKMHRVGGASYSNLLIRSAGFYWIDPNGGCSMDAFQVHCGFEDGSCATCIDAKDWVCSRSLTIIPHWSQYCL